MYEYGCLPPLEGERELLDALFRRNALWNKLVEIDRLFEQKFRTLTRESMEAAGLSKSEFEALEREVLSLRAQRDELRKEIAERRRTARSGRIDVSDLTARLKEIESPYREKRAKLKEIERAAREANRAAFDALEAERKEAAKEAVRSAGLWWCNADEERLEYEAARKRVLRDRAAGKSASLRFHRFDGSGKLVVRLRERGTAGPWGMSIENVFKPNGAFWIEPVPPEAWGSPVRAVRRKAARTKVHFRLDSNGREPVWAVLPTVMHRPLPPDGIVRQASLVRERVGRRFRYRLAVTVELPRNGAASSIREGAAAVDLGWRRVGGGVRVAYWLDDRGNQGQLVLPDRMLNAFLKLRELRSLRDRHFDEAKKALAEFLKRAQTPDWLREALRGLDRWRSQGRLIAVLRRWREARFPSDEGVFGWLEEWRRRENHLYDWESNLRDQALRWRREEYRKFARRLARGYAAVVLEDFDLRGVARSPDPEDGTRGSIPPDYQRFVAAPSELRLCIENACRREGTEVARAEAAFTTLRCHACGHTERFDAAAQLWHTCPACGELWDQDHNACANLLERYFSGECRSPRP